MAKFFFGKMAATLLVGAGLAGCVNADIDVAFVDANTAEMTTTTTIGADFYGMIKASAAEAGEDAGSEEFCGTGTLTELDDGGATCVDVLKGSLDELNANNAEDQGGLSFSAEGANLVRVTLPMEAVSGQLGSEEMDAETKTMMASMFADNALTFTVRGVEIVESNMEISQDKTTATLALKFAELLTGEVEFPSEYFALVRTP